MQQYDIASKVLIDRCRDDIIRYLLDMELVYRSEKTRPVKADMLTSMAILSGLVSPELPARLIARRKDIMIESAAYDIIKKEGYAEGRKEANQDNARNLLLLGILTDEQIAQATGLKMEEIRALKKETKK